MNGLHALEDQIQADLALMEYPKRDWVKPRLLPNGETALDVLIIGGGQGGLAVAFGLMREKVRNLLVLDANPAMQEGPWRTFARMITLRTPKHLTGPDLGLPHLTIRAWYEAQHGERTWDTLGLLPKETWADYLHWYRNTLGIPVENGARAGALAWDEATQCFAVPVTSEDGTTRTVHARKVVLATGIEGAGQWQTPQSITESLPPHLYAHTHAPIDFGRLQGRRVGILGAGACAFDNAAVALESGAAEVHQFFRRSEMVRVNPYRWMEFVGFLKHHADLPDAQKWRFMRQIVQMGQLPPANTYARATQFENHHLHPSSPWQKVEAVGDGARVTTPAGVFDLDYLIVGTGFRTDLSVRPELANLHSHIALWRDCFTPPEGDGHADLLNHPYLGPYFETQEKRPGDAPYLHGLFNFTFGALLSLGLSGASISGMKYSVPRLVSGITRQFYREGADAYFADLEAYDVTDF
jgi:cation diffusion facilitator CzcD-associated flavoprotein CzcO